MILDYTKECYAISISFEQNEGLNSKSLREPIAVKKGYFKTNQSNPILVEAKESQVYREVKLKRIFAFNWKETTLALLTGQPGFDSQRRHKINTKN